MYESAVVLIVALHFAFIGYVVAGGFLALRWRRTMWLHVPAVIWGTAIAANRVDCPLTWGSAGLAPGPECRRCRRTDSSPTTSPA